MVLTRELNFKLINYDFSWQLVGAEGVAAGSEPETLRGLTFYPSSNCTKASEEDISCNPVIILKKQARSYDQNYALNRISAKSWNIKL